MKRFPIVAIFFFLILICTQQAFGIVTMSSQSFQSASGNLQPNDYPDVACDTTYTDTDKALGAFYLLYPDSDKNFSNCKNSHWKKWCFICHDPNFSVDYEGTIYSYDKTVCKWRLSSLTCPVPTAVPTDVPPTSIPTNTPINCVWSEWSACSVSCGPGTQTRSHLVEAQYGGTACTGDATKNCNIKNCPVDCVWSSPGPCVKDGTGCSTTRTHLVEAQYGGVDCAGSAKQVCYACSNTSSQTVGSGGETLSVTLLTYTASPLQTVQGPAVTQATSKNSGFDLFSKPADKPVITGVLPTQKIEGSGGTIVIITQPPVPTTSNPHSEPIGDGNIVVPPTPTPPIYVPPTPSPTIRPESIIPPSLASQTNGNGKAAYNVDVNQLSNITVAPGVAPASDPILSKEQRLLANNAVSGGIMVGLQQKSGSQYITQQDELMVKRGNQFFSITNQATSQESDKSKNAPQLQINANNVIAKSNMGLSIDPLSGVLTVQTPNGPQKVSIMPDEALGIVLELKALNNGVPEPSILLVSEKGKLIYRISGEKVEKFLGLLPLPIQKQILVSADTGSIITVELSLLSRILSFFTF